MKVFKSVVLMTAFAVALAAACTEPPCVLANSLQAAKLPTKPTSAMPTSATIVLSPTVAEELFESSFDADSIFGKQEKLHAVKETYWVPTNADVARADAVLATYMSTSTHPFRGPVQNDLSHYFRQYAGVMRGEKKIILISGFPADVKRGIAGYNHILMVSDGGSAFFHAAFNPQTRKIQDFKFNDPG